MSSKARATGKFILLKRGEEKKVTTHHLIDYNMFFLYFIYRQVIHTHDPYFIIFPPKCTFHVNHFNTSVPKAIFPLFQYQLQIGNILFLLLESISTAVGRC